MFKNIADYDVRSSRYEKIAQIKSMLPFLENPQQKKQKAHAALEVNL